MKGANKYGDEDFAFDSFADPAGLIMANIIEDHCERAPNRKALLAAAKALKLPNNPLVGLPGTPARDLAARKLDTLRVPDIVSIVLRRK